MKICAVYKITNIVTGDFYIGSSKNVKERWRSHKKPSVWKRHPNNPMYLDMQKFGVDKFEFQVIAEVEPDKLKEMEQQFIETLKPNYNQMNAKGRNIERRKKSNKKYEQSEKGKKSQKKYDNQLCFYNGETLKLHALASRFRKAGIPHSTVEAKKYLIKD